MNKLNQNRKLIYLIAGAAAAVLIVAVILLRAGGGGTDEIVMPKLSFVHYEDTLAQLREAGFTNIVEVPSVETYEWESILGEEGTVMSVKIDGRNVSEGKAYPADSEVTVTYYRFE